MSLLEDEGTGKAEQSGHKVTHTKRDSQGGSRKWQDIPFVTPEQNNVLDSVRFNTLRHVFTRFLVLQHALGFFKNYVKTSRVSRVKSIN